VTQKKNQRPPVDPFVDLDRHLDAVASDIAAEQVRSLGPQLAALVKICARGHEMTERRLVGAIRQHVLEARRRTDCLAGSTTHSAIEHQARFWSSAFVVLDAFRKSTVDDQDFNEAVVLFRRFVVADVVAHTGKPPA